MGGNSSKTMTTNLNENLTVISQQPFAFTLINLLKDKGVITTGITIPFIIGAYKIAKHDSIEVNLKFIQEVFADIVATAKDTKFLVLIYIFTLKNHRKAGVGKSPNQSFLFI